MNQPIRFKKNKQNLPSFKLQTQPNFPLKRASQTPDFQRNLSKNMLKKKKTPHKHQIHQQQIKKEESLNKDKSQRAINKNYLNQNALCKIQQLTTPDLKCKKCENNQKQIKQLELSLKQYEKNKKEFQEKFQLLKQDYERKLKKYKVKSRIQKDQLKLLKWILSERKEFHQILQKLEKMKEKGIQPLQDFDKQNINQDEIGLTDRTLPKNSMTQKIKFQQKERKSEVQDFQMIYEPTSLKNTKIGQSQKQKNPTQRELQMFNHINVLEQKVMELTMQNDFLEKIKIKIKEKQKQKCKKKSQSNESISFTKDCIIAKNATKYHPLMSYHDEDLIKDYQYSEDEQSFENQSNVHSNYNFHQNSLFNSLYREKFDAQSRYVSPLKQRLNYSNFQQQLKDFHKKEEKNQEKIPESRSKYFDSIKERSRLLGI